MDLGGNGGPVSSPQVAGEVDAGRMSGEPQTAIGAIQGLINAMGDGDAGEAGLVLHPAQLGLDEARCGRVEGR